MWDEASRRRARKLGVQESGIASSTSGYRLKV